MKLDGTQKKILWIAIVAFCLAACSADQDALDAEAQFVSQPADLSSVTYTIRVKSSQNCDVEGVKVDVDIPISAVSDVLAGETLELTHKIGRVKRNQRKKKEFTVATGGALVLTDSIKAEVSDVDGFSACVGLFGL